MRCKKCSEAKSQQELKEQMLKEDENKERLLPRENGKMSRMSVKNVLTVLNIFRFNENFFISTNESNILGLLTAGRRT